MTMREQRAVDAELLKYKLIAALRMTEPVERDVPRPTTGHSIGYVDDKYPDSYILGDLAWSESGSHGYGSYDPSHRTRSASQGGIALHSTRLRALKASRHLIELEMAKTLMRIDRMIKEEAAKEIER